MMIFYGCTPLVVVTSVEATRVARDPRTTGSQLEDQVIASKFSDLIKQHQAGNVSLHAEATSYNRKVLLTGQVPNSEISEKLANLARSIENVTHVFNEFQIKAPSSNWERAEDALITISAKSALISENNLRSDDFKIKTESGIVYLLGATSASMLQLAAEKLKTVKNAKKIVLLVDKVDP